VRLLILGGTVFLGRAVARAAREAGHDVLCAARGRSGSVPDGVDFQAIDRDDPATLSALDGQFDAVVDVSRIPRQVSGAVEALGDRVGHWVFVSSCSVYADHSTPAQTPATAPLLEPAGPGADDTDMETYGPRKVACELALPPGSFSCRAGLIVGPEDVGNRFSYWVSRLERGGEVLAPGSPDDAVQWVDVRDLARWLVLAAETRLGGAFDGICAPTTRLELLRGIASGIGVEPELTWVDQDFLAAQGIGPWMGERTLPMWLPLPEYAGFMARDTTPSLQAGLSIRPVADTARDTLAWLATGPEIKLSAGITPSDESAVLAAWHNRPTT
jgi:nucleoside-diphosphate-sugar epimerase